MLFTAELEATIEYYTTVLGFNLEELNQERGLCNLTKDKVSIMFALPNQNTPFEGPSLQVHCI